MQRVRQRSVSMACFAGLLAGVLAAPSSAQTTHTVTQVGFSFSTQHIVIEVGDIVEWVWTSDIHSVTEGPGPVPTGGEAFDELHSPANPIVRVQFDRTLLDAFPRVDNVYDYYCIPHWGLGMAGTVTVLETLDSYSDGGAEVPPTPSLGTGSGAYTLDLTSNTLSWNISYSGLSGPATAAHFHRAPVGSNGPIEIGVGTTNPAVGSAVLTPAQRADVLAGLWYLNVHTAAFPGGEIRGQIQSGNWMDLGGGTPGVNGTPTLRGTGTLVEAAPFSINLEQGPSSTLVLLWIAATPVPSPAIGGVIHAVPFVDQILLATDVNGRLLAGALWPVGSPSGVDVFFQYVLLDGTSPFGLTLSNGLKATTP